MSRACAYAPSVNDHGSGIVPELRGADRPLYSGIKEDEAFAYRGTYMTQTLQVMLTVVFATLLLVPASLAEGKRVKPSRAADTSAPVKDCTRFNGRFGYYGNPWCTPAEQQRWDRWEAGRLPTPR